MARKFKQFKLVFFSQITIARTRGNDFKFHPGGFRLDIIKKFFIKMLIEHWNRVAREVVESLEELRTPVDVLFMDMV